MRPVVSILECSEFVLYPSDGTGAIAGCSVVRCRAEWVAGGDTWWRQTELLGSSEGVCKIAASGEDEAQEDDQEEEAGGVHGGGV